MTRVCNTQRKYGLNYCSQLSNKYSTQILSTINFVIFYSDLMVHFLEVVQSFLADLSILNALISAAESQSNQAPLY
jgi:hypothetical protein